MRDDVEILDEYLCPITQEIMKNPMMTIDGYSYEKEAIERWFAVSNRSPKTNLEFSSKTLMPNHNLRNAIETFMERSRDALQMECVR